MSSLKRALNALSLWYISPTGHLDVMSSDGVCDTYGAKVTAGMLSSQPGCRNVGVDLVLKTTSFVLAAISRIRFPLKSGWGMSHSTAWH